jgi:hypothetical protein
MVVAWAYAEERMIFVLARVTSANVNLMQSGYYRIPTFEARIKFIRALIGDWKGDGFDKGAIDKEVEKLAGLASARNHWVHGDWCENRATGEVVLFDHRAVVSSAHRRKPVKAADVRNHIEAVLSRADTLFSLVRGEELPI